MARIKIDRSDTLNVVVCESCNGIWRACAWDLASAYDAAADHEQRAHPGEQHAREARNEARRRAARRRAARRRATLRARHADDSSIEGAPDQ